jgi:hypothetical protein
VPLLGAALQFGVGSPESVLEAAWCLTNIASGDTDQATAVLPTAPLLIAHLQGRAHPQSCRTISKFCGVVAMTFESAGEYSSQSPVSPTEKVDCLSNNASRESSPALC